MSTEEEQVNKLKNELNKLTTELSDMVTGMGPMMEFNDLSEEITKLKKGMKRRTHRGMTAKGIVEEGDFSNSVQLIVQNLVHSLLFDLYLLIQLLIV